MHGCRNAAVAAMALVGALGAVAATASAAPDAKANGHQGTVSVTPGTGIRVQPGLERALLREMNVARAEYEVAPLKSKASLHKAARKHSLYLSKLGRLDHDSAGGKPFWTRLVKAGFPRNSSMGENLALVGGCGRPAGYVQLRRSQRQTANASEARRVVAMWLKSPGHRANLLNPDFRYAGAGVTTDSACSATMYTADYGG
jgi:uncharacterized protein YkwD